MTPSVPLRRSLLLRLLTGSVVVALCSIAATAWLAVQTTTTAIQDEQGQALSDDAMIYDALVGYAATHPDWSGVAPVLADLAGETGRQIAIASRDRDPVATSGGPSPPFAARASAEIDALNVDPSLLPSAVDGIDERVTGPYRLDAAARERQWAIAAERLRCGGVGDVGGPAVRATQDLAGYVEMTPAELPPYPDKSLGEVPDCVGDELARPTPSESAALAELAESVDTCLREQGRRPPAALTTSLVDADGRVVAEPPSVPFGEPADREARACLTTAQRDQLDPYAAPAVLLFVRSPDGGPTARFDLSAANLVRILGVATGVLVLAVIATVLLGARVVRPLRALTAAAQHPTELHTRVPVVRPDEIGVLATALNTLAERRERADEQRAAMVRDVAHELRTPLSNVRAWLEAMQDGLADPATDPLLLPAILDEAHQLQAIIDDLQYLAEADASGPRHAPEPVRVADVLEQVITAHAARASASGVDLVAEIADDVVVHADPSRLRQALGNLVANAVRYSPEHSTVRLGSHLVGDQVEISVADVGIGISPSDLPHVFERFWRVDRSRSRDSGGSGLGLAIVKEIVEAHGGSVGATSEPGRGSTFTIRLAVAP